MFKTILNILAWVFGYHMVLVCPTNWWLVEMAMPLIDAAAKLPHNDVTPEYRRHVVYAQMLKNAPFTPKRDIAFAIECAIQRRRG